MVNEWMGEKGKGHWKRVRRGSKERGRGEGEKGGCCLDCWVVKTKTRLLGAMLGHGSGGQKGRLPRTRYDSVPRVCQEYSSQGRVATRCREVMQWIGVEFFCEHSSGIANSIVSSLPNSMQGRPSTQPSGLVRNHATTPTRDCPSSPPTPIPSMSISAQVTATLSTQARLPGRLRSPGSRLQLLQQPCLLPPARLSAFIRLLA